MIQIIKGTYGYQDKNGIVKPKTAADEPFELSEAQEARLVERGVAVYVNAGSTALPGGVVGVSWDVTMKADKLRAIAKEMGLTFPVGTSKAAMVEAMDKHMADIAEAGETAGEDYSVDGDEDAPTFDATEAVD